MSPTPILSFHSIGDDPLPFELRHLTAPPEMLEGILKWLTKHRFKTISLGDYFEHLESKKEIPKKSLVLAFDDGYLDNWCFVHPLLKKYGHCGFILVTPEFVQKGEICRPTMEDVDSGLLLRQELPSRGYCNWAELGAMQSAGTLEVYSHFQTHAWWPISNKLVDFHRPGHVDISGIWNANPSAKPNWLDPDAKDIGMALPWGTPIYESARSQSAPRITVDKNVAATLVEHVDQNGGAEFFTKPGWETELSSMAKALTATAQIQRETQADFEKRLQFECQESRRQIEINIPGHKCRFLGWPGGEWNETAQRIALETYDATLTTHPHATRLGENPHLIHRFFFGQRSHELTGWVWPSVMKFSSRLGKIRGDFGWKIRDFIANRAIGFGSRFCRGNRGFR